ncbi:MAG: hypothetical protein GY941_11155 [Planctomycetes bacterium]|nr:hypothetical protein [Planctomycetota bacterium]
MKTEYDVDQIVWSFRNEEWVNIAVIHVSKWGVVYVDHSGVRHKPTELGAEEPSITHEQFMNVVNANPLESMDLEDVWEIVQECFKVAQK